MNGFCQANFKKCSEVANVCAASNLRRASRAIAQIYNEIMRPTGLLGTQFTLLVALCLTGSINISRLAQILVMDRTTLGRNIKPLSKKGLVKIFQGEDRRLRMVTLTDKGHEALSKALPLWEIAQRQVVNQLGRKRFETMLDDLKKTVSLVQLK